MDLPNLKELKNILKLCRSQGVTKLTLAELIIEFGDLPTEIKGGERVIIADDDDASAAPSAEDMAYWSAAPDPLALREGAEQ